jgi:protein-S-isoprenylcysteine O-methyltransferase Ste14
METPRTTDRPLKRRRIHRVTALILWPILIPLVHAGVPWGLSLLTTRHGWINGHPGVGNLLGLVAVVAGVSGIIWCLYWHYVACPPVVEATWFHPPYLLTDGPYARSRNPMYIAALVLWIGWAVFYGSVAVLLTILVVSASIIPWFVRAEEHSLEADFGERYLRYKKEVPRWLGRIQR